MTAEVTVGIDIGTTSVKAIAADGDGGVVGRARVPHGLMSSNAGELAHDAAEAWHRGVRVALDEVLADAGDVEVRGVNVAAMVPSLCAVGADGVPISPGLLYGDQRGAGGDPGKNPSESGELVRFLDWLADRHPDAAGFWPAQGVGNHAVRRGRHRHDRGHDRLAAVRLHEVGSGGGPLGGCGRRRPAPEDRGGQRGGRTGGGGRRCAAGRRDHRRPRRAARGGRRPRRRRAGDPGATFIVWAVVPDWREVPGLWTVPHTTPGKVLIGGPSNSGGLFQDWAGRLVGPVPPGALPADPHRVPVWLPYLRGERAPPRSGPPGLPARARHRPRRRLGPAGRSEASGFAARHQFDLAGLSPTRIVASGGGTRDRAWLQALADATRLPVDTVRVPEGGALGAAYLARVTAGLEADATGAGRWPRSASGSSPTPPGPPPATSATPATGSWPGEPARRRVPGPAGQRGRPRRAQVGDVRFTVISVDDHLVEPPHLFEGECRRRWPTERRM
ncbi:MAG: FGGY-family carbohydrate kinase [Acidimicrobiales bacterium]